jgi:hypothetical protein
MSTLTAPASIVAALRTQDLPDGVLEAIAVLDAWDFTLERIRATADAEKVGQTVSEDFLDQGFLAVRMFLAALKYSHVLAGSVPGLVKLTPSAELDLIFESCVVLNLNWEQLCRAVFGDTVYHVMGAADTTDMVHATQASIITLFKVADTPWEFFQPGDCGKSCKVINCWGIVGSPN